MSSSVALQIRAGLTKASSCIAWYPKSDLASMSTVRMKLPVLCDKGKCDTLK
jgi:hypothetical protein